MQELPFFIELGRGFIGILLTPFFYLAILLIYLQYRRQVSLERRLFGIRVTSAEQQTIRSVLYGVLGGIAASLLMAGLGIVLNPTDFIYVWVLAVVLAIFNVRFICFAYAGGILSAISLVLQSLPEFSVAWPWLGSIYTDLRELSISHLLALVAVLHLIEAFLVAMHGKYGASPVVVLGKRGRLIGGFILQKFWAIPLAAVVVTGTAGFDAPHWWLLLPAASFQGLQVLPVPAVLGYSAVALARHPAEKAARSAKWLAVYAAILLALSIGGSYVNWLLWIAAVFSPLAHELLIWWETTDEKIRQPRFIKPLQGVRILAILPDSPAASMELHPGEIISKVNGAPVNSPFDLHFAINQNPAFIKIEVIDEQGEIRFVGKPRFSGEHHSLGIILTPDESAREFVRLDSIPIWKRVWNTLSVSKRGTKSSA